MTTGVSEIQERISAAIEKGIGELKTSDKLHFALLFFEETKGSYFTKSKKNVWEEWALPLVLKPDSSVSSELLESVLRA